MKQAASILPLAFDRVSYAVGDKRLLDDVSFTLGAAGRTIVLGPNGAGKSLTLRLAHGLIPPSSGAVRWSDDGQRTRDRQAMVFERPVLLRRTTSANIEYALRVRGVPRNQRKLRVAQALEQTGLEALAARPARVLSAGERQRLAIARAWALRPQVLFLDEPAAALDPAATAALESLVEEIADAGTKVIMTTHDLAQARRLADDVLFFFGGRLLEHSSAERFFATPDSEHAQAFIEGRLTW